MSGLLRCARKDDAVAGKVMPKCRRDEMVPPLVSLRRHPRKSESGIAVVLGWGFPLLEDRHIVRA